MGGAFEMSFLTNNIVTEVECSTDQLRHEIKKGNDWIHTYTDLDSNVNRCKDARLSSVENETEFHLNQGEEVDMC